MAKEKYVIRKSLILRREVYEQVKKLAEDNERTLAAQVRFIINEWFKLKGK